MNILWKRLEKNFLLSDKPKTNDLSKLLSKYNRAS